MRVLEREAGVVARSAVMFMWFLSLPLLAQSGPEDEPLESWGENEQAESLDYTQKEKQERFGSGIAVNVGTVMPWAELGLTYLWNQTDTIHGLSLGVGDFEFSDTYQKRNYVVKTSSQSAYYTRRWFPLPFGPIYLEPIAGLVHWDGSIQPRGTDPITDELASALTSKFSATGISIGGNLGLMWIFSNRIFIEYNLIGITWSHFLSQYYSTSASAARSNVRHQIQGPLSMGSAHLRIGWSWNL